MADKIFKSPLDEFQALVNEDPDTYRETLRNKKGWSEGAANSFESATRQPVNPYLGKSLADLDNEGWNGSHNQIVNRLRNSGFDSYEDVLAAIDKGFDGPFDDKQKQYLDAYARRVFGID